ncbi:MAG: GGDEF domain-containing protein [Desulfobacteraceae bacterium]
MNNLDIYIQKDFKLPSPPVIAVRILEAVKDEHAAPKTLSKIISGDPALAARILKFANASLYSTCVKIDSIERAVSVLGTENLKNIALSFAIVKAHQGELASRFDFNRFWKRSLTSAVSSNLLAEKMGMDKGNSFVAGLLKDIGMLYMYLAKPEDYLDVFKEQMCNNLPLVESERAIFGFDHQEIGAAIMEHWSFPGQIYRAIRFHHRIMEAPVSIREETRLLSLADKVSSAYHGCNTISRVKEINNAFYRNKAIRDEAVTAFMDQVGEQTLEILSSFDMDSGGMQPYSQLLQEANEELGKLNLSYEQLILDLKQARKKSDQLASELKKANDQLRLLALRDGLTTLYSHTYFQDILVKEISKARRYKRTLSLIILDIDHFKSVNDTYGHLIGDGVLRQVAKQIKKTIRIADIAARYGGEAFALILPETNSKGALILAERLRNVIEEMPLSSDGRIDFGITISAGVATHDPSMNNTITTAEMIQHARRGLYFAKNSGRNQVSMFRDEN